MNASNSKDLVGTQSPMSGVSIPGAVVTPKGDLDFDMTVGAMTRCTPERIVVRLATLYAEQFDSIASRFHRADIHVLALAGSYNVFHLADPLFDPADELCAVLETDEAWDRISQHEIAAALNLDREIAELTQKLCGLDPDDAKALWAALVFGQHASLSEADWLVAPWWTAAFITGWGSQQHET